MNKYDLTRKLSAEMDITQQEALRFIDSLGKVITETLSKKNDIALQGFGVLEPWKQSERLGRNPKNGTPCMIRERVSVKFRPGKFLLDTINKKSEELK
ncbi:HU family DNA-binding protein [Parabacteroides bouchesdurhonensis]|uniref:HU family DNA-binding protein n=1 Tax=Parabacteroides bouchesdurhonensis TaxID=1936995 RepID=UPI000C866861|nr:HU family DNA-binding protein [Parabacteroides bouchesdurhonensis]